MRYLLTSVFGLETDKTSPEIREQCPEFEDEKLVSQVGYGPYGLRLFFHEGSDESSIRKMISLLQTTIDYGYIIGSFQIDFLKLSESFKSEFYKVMSDLEFTSDVEIVFRGCKFPIDFDDAKQLKTSLSKCKRLRFEQCHFDHRVFLPCIPPELTSLEFEIGGNVGSISGLFQSISSIFFHVESLKEFSLVCCRESFNDLHCLYSSAFDSLVVTLSKYRTLEKITLTASDCMMMEKYCKSLNKAFAMIIESNPNLKQIHLPNNNLDRERASILTSLPESFNEDCWKNKFDLSNNRWLQ